MRVPGAVHGGDDAGSDPCYDLVGCGIAFYTAVFMARVRKTHHAGARLSCGNRERGDYVLLSDDVCVRCARLLSDGSFVPVYYFDTCIFPEKEALEKWILCGTARGGRLESGVAGPFLDRKEQKHTFLILSSQLHHIFPVNCIIESEREKETLTGTEQKVVRERSNYYG